MVKKGGGTHMAFGFGGFGCGPVAAPVAPAVIGGFSPIGVILVLFILLVIISRSILC
jgi:hypothetical protein